MKSIKSEGLVDELKKEISALKLENASLTAHYRLNQLSVIGKFKKKIDMLYGFIRRVFVKKTKVTIVPMQDVYQISTLNYKSVSNDPQLYVKVNNPASIRNKWVEIKYECVISSPVEQQIFFDLGNGFSEKLSLKFLLKESGVVVKGLYFPSAIKNIRLDPMNAKGDFSILKFEITVREDFEARGLISNSEIELSKLLLSYSHKIELGDFNNAVKISEDSEYYESMSNDPNAIINNVLSIMPDPGWYYFTCNIEQENNRDQAKFYIDYGHGYVEEESISINYESKKTANRVVYIAKPVVNIRFDPLEKRADFQLHEVSIRKLEESEAIEIMNEFIKKSSTIECENSDIYVLEKKYTSAVLESDKADYDDWINEVEKTTDVSVGDAQIYVDTLKDKPLFSIIMPTYNTENNLLVETIESVVNQSYPYWELCICDDASTDKGVINILKSYEKRHSNIKVSFRENNGHISASSNDALELARGDYVVLMDHDDLLPVNSLFYIARTVAENPRAEIIYSDEDKIDLSGKRFDPHFKSDWNLDLFYSQNYVSHLGVYKHSLVKSIGGFRLGVEGSQDYDLMLRCLPHVCEENILHVPRVLYHWRVIEGSTALGASEKDYTSKAGLKALKDHFKENYSSDVLVYSGKYPNTYRVRWPIPKNQPLVSLIIPTRDGLDVLEVAVKSILNMTTYNNYEIIILNNGSVEKETLAFFDNIVCEEDRVSVVDYDRPFNYSAINNFGVKVARGSIIGLINNDVEVITPDWLTEMVSQVNRPGIGCVGAKLYFSNDTVQHGGVVLGIGGVAGHSHKYFDREHSGYFSRLDLVQNLSAVTAACLLVRKEVYDEVGGLEENLAVAFNDVDFCLKVRSAGYKNLWTPYAELYHYESISRGAEDTPEKVKRFNSEVKYMQEKWGDKLNNDPFYNVNLSTKREDFSIAIIDDFL